METINKEAREYAIGVFEDFVESVDFFTQEDFEKAVKHGVELAQRWIDVEKESPVLGVSVLLFNEQWIDEDYNPDGVRIGFRQDYGFVSAHWWNYQDCYMTISKEECDNNPIYSEAIKNTTEPTHWRPIEFK